MTWDPKHRKEIAKLFRWLADETEAGRADGDLEITTHAEPIPKPRSWFDNPAKPVEYEVVRHGATWTMRVKTIMEPLS